MPGPLVQLDVADAVDGRHLRAVAFQQVRLDFIRERVASHPSPCGTAVVVGGGRGLLARGLAADGRAVVSVDPSAAATALAQQSHDGPEVEYRTAPAEGLGLGSDSVDHVHLADTLEVRPDLQGVLAEAARVLRPGGLLTYDTVARTLVSRLVYLVGFQAFPLTRIVPRGRYGAGRLRTPAEMAVALRRAGLRPESPVAFEPTGIGALIGTVIARRRGGIGDEEIADRVGFTLQPGHRPVVTYLGAGSSPPS